MNPRDKARLGFRGRLLASTRCLLAGILVVGAFLSGCASEERDLKVAEAAVGVFHSQLDSEKYAAIYQAASATMKETTSEPDFVKLLEGVHRTLGGVQDSAPKGVVFLLAQGTIRLDYDTTFARGTGRERFVWQVTNGQAILFSYHVSSRDLAKQ